MPDQGYGLRPDVDGFEHTGCAVALVDPALILATAAERRVELLHGAAFPAPVRLARLSVALGPQGYRLDGSVRTGPDKSPRTNDPIGAFFARQVANNEPWTRVAAGVGVAMTEVTRRLGLSNPGEVADEGELLREVSRADEPTGLRATVTYRAVPEGRLVGLRATVPADEMGTAQLRAVTRLLLDIVVELAGAAPERLTVSSTVDSADQVSLDQVGGLEDIVAELRQIAVSFLHPQAMARWGAQRPQGVLLYGPPGTGKTMLARALANEIGANFREIRTPEILDKWLGASERNIKRIFRDIRRYREPTVVLFDEFDSIIGYVGEGRDSASQAVNAVAGIFKQEMNDLIETTPNVIVVATTNFPERVDQSLIRSGRFDVKLAVPVPDEHGRAQILAKMIRQLILEHEGADFRMFADDLDLAALGVASYGMTGADLKEVLRRAQLAKAMLEARTGAPSGAISQADLRATMQGLRAGRVAGPTAA